MVENSLDLSKNERFFLMGLGVGLFVLITVGFFILFQSYGVDLSITTIMSVVSGGLIIWIILMTCGLLKEFSIKGGSMFELSAKIDSVREETKSVAKEITRDVTHLSQNFHTSIQSLNGRIDNVMNNISNSSAKSESKTVNNYYQSRGELLAAIDSSGIPESKIEPEKNISKEQIEKIDTLWNKVNALEESLDKPIKLPLNELLKTANYYFYKKNYKKAKKAYENILSQSPNNIDTLFNLAYCETELKKYDDSINHYKKILELDSQRADVLHNIGYAYIKKTDHDNALKYYKKAVQADPKDAKLQAAVAKVLRELGKFEEASEYYENALKIDPNDISVLSGIASNHYYKREIKQARDYATKLLTLEAKNRTDEIDHIVANIILGNYEKAIKDCDNMLLSDHEDDSALYNKACALSMLNRTSEAMDNLEHAIDLEPFNKVVSAVDPDLDNIRNEPRFKKLISS